MTLEISNESFTIICIIIGINFIGLALAKIVKWIVSSEKLEAAIDSLFIAFISTIGGTIIVLFAGEIGYLSEIERQIISFSLIGVLIFLFGLIYFLVDIKKTT